MVDEYMQGLFCFCSFWSVQIPLWSMNTASLAVLCTTMNSFRFLYGRWIHPWYLHHFQLTWVQIPLWSMNTWMWPKRNLWRSLVQIPLWSMNTLSHETIIGQHPVQIPLWSMNTFWQGHCSISLGMFRFLYGRWVLLFVNNVHIVLASSDSSMVDEYLQPNWIDHLLFRVQIPLWSMSTHQANASSKPSGKSSDSSMVDEYLTL